MGQRNILNMMTKMFEPLNTSNKDYIMYNGSAYVECNLIQVCVNNTEQESRNKMATKRILIY